MSCELNSKAIVRITKARPRRQRAYMMAIVSVVGKGAASSHDRIFDRVRAG